MKILPFVLKHSHSSSLTITGLSLFLSQAGKALWQTEEPTLSIKQLEQEYLLPNGLIPKQIVVNGSVAYVEVDPEKTRLQDFYTWEEALSSGTKPECWRTFWFFTDETNAEWFTCRYSQGDNELDGKPIYDFYEEAMKLATKQEI